MYSILRIRQNYLAHIEKTSNENTVYVHGEYAKSILLYDNWHKLELYLGNFSTNTKKILYNLSMKGGMVEKPKSRVRCKELEIKLWVVQDFVNLLPYLSQILTKIKKVTIKKNLRE